MQSSPPPTRIVERIPSPEDINSQTQAAAFWASIALPALYLPLLWTGLSSGEVVLFLALVGVNVVALILGHDYKR